MNSHWLKQVYARMLKENTDPEALIKLFKKEEDKKLDHFATIKQKYVDGVIKSAKSKEAEGTMDLSHAYECLKKFDPSGKNDNLKKAFLEAITTYTMTFTPENTSRCATGLLANISDGKVEQLTDLLQESFDCIITNDSEIGTLVELTGKIGNTIGIGKGEYALGLFSYGEPVPNDKPGDIIVGGKILEIKGIDARVGKFSDHSILPIKAMEIAVNDPTVENFQQILVSIAGGNVSEEIINELKNTSAGFIQQNINTLKDAFAARISGKKLPRGGIPKQFLRFGVMAQLKNYQKLANYDYYVFIGIKDEGFPFIGIDIKNKSIQDLWNIEKITFENPSFGTAPKGDDGYSKGAQLNYSF